MVVPEENIHQLSLGFQSTRARDGFHIKIGIEDETYIYQKIEYRI